MNISLRNNQQATQQLDPQRQNEKHRGFQSKEVGPLNQIDMNNSYDYKKNTDDLQLQYDEENDEKTTARETDVIQKLNYLKNAVKQLQQEGIKYPIQAHLENLMKQANSSSMPSVISSPTSTERDRKLSKNSRRSRQERKNKTQTAVDNVYGDPSQTMYRNRGDIASQQTNFSEIEFVRRSQEDIKKTGSTLVSDEKNKGSRSKRYTNNLDSQNTGENINIDDQHSKKQITNNKTQEYTPVQYRAKVYSTVGNIRNENSKEREYFSAQTIKEINQNQVSNDIPQLLQLEQLQTKKLEKKLKRYREKVDKYKSESHKKSSELKLAQGSIANLIKQNEEQKQYYDYHINQFIQIQRESDLEKAQQSEELRILRSQLSERDDKIDIKLKQIQQINQDLTKENHNLIKILNDEKQIIEIDKIRGNMNKLIDESLKDKNVIDKLQKTIEIQDQELQKNQRKMDRKNDKIEELERGLSELSEKLKNDYRNENQLRMDNLALNKLLAEVVKYCQLSNFNQILPFLQDLSKQNKQTYKFVEKLQKLMITKTIYQRHPDVKDLWRWVKSLCRAQEEQPLVVNLYLSQKKSRIDSQSPSAIKPRQSPNTHDKNEHFQYDQNYLSTMKVQQVQLDRDHEFTLRQQEPIISGEFQKLTATQQIPSQLNNSKQQTYEQLRSENQYMDHILGKVKDLLSLDKEIALIDVEMYLNHATQGINNQNQRRKQ
ncbi:UNKNOWN [Stylonychia lemnae]|uniref:Uncharacterized protein n=1 Tax=Stylonychia lemnae TaxID=5949 RepID=A0A077ZRG5_STYLE|nr:UNKNOWN [Stylonychia lemnae]|eukprot:CDW72049.1 UNKNOWN [Stylonychia lemnae]